MFRRDRIVQQGASCVAQVAGKQDRTLLTLFFQLEIDTGRAEDVAGVEKSGMQTRGKDERLVIVSAASEMIGTVECIQYRIQRPGPCG